MKVIRFAILAMCVFASIAFAQERNYPEGMQNCTVELNGDSVLFGYANNAESRLNTPPAQWLRNQGYTVEDNTAGGLRTSDLVHGYLMPFAGAWPALYPKGAQMAFWNMPHDSRIIVIQTGINDFKDPFNPQQVYQDYSYLVDYIRGIGKIPVITGVSQISQSVGNDTFGKVQQIRSNVRQVAIDKGVHYASFDAVPIALTDGFHLTQASSNGIAENLRYVLSVICGVQF